MTRLHAVALTGVCFFLSLVTITPQAHYRKHGAVYLPDADVTPGAIRTTDPNELCAPGFTTKKYRGPARLHIVYLEYSAVPYQGLCSGAGCEGDHLIPLELGGADVIKNKWIQPPDRPDVPGWQTKDKLENYLRKRVCTVNPDVRDEVLRKAQEAIRTDWYQAYLDAGLK